MQRLRASKTWVRDSRVNVILIIRCNTCFPWPAGGFCNQHPIKASHQLEAENHIIKWILNIIVEQTSEFNHVDVALIFWVKKTSATLYHMDWELCHNSTTFLWQSGCLFFYRKHLAFNEPPVIVHFWRFPRPKTTESFGVEMRVLYYF